MFFICAGGYDSLENNGSEEKQGKPKKCTCFKDSLQD